MRQAVISKRGLGDAASGDHADAPFSPSRFRFLTSRPRFRFHVPRVSAPLLCCMEGIPMVPTTYGVFPTRRSLCGSDEQDAGARGMGSTGRNRLRSARGAQSLLLLLLNPKWSPVPSDQGGGQGGAGGRELAEN